MSLRRSLNVGFGAARVAFGVLATVAPARVGRTWIGAEAESPRTKVILRALGGRDVALGVGTIAGALDDRATPWLAVSTAADLGDLLATVLARGELDRRGVAVTSVVAGSAAIAGAVLVAIDRPTD